MSYKISYVTKSGEHRTKICSLSKNDAIGWAQKITEEHGNSKTEHINDSGKITHIVTHGNKDF